MEQPGVREQLDRLANVGVFVPDTDSLWSFAGTLFRYDPAAALSEMQVPLLALFGASDQIVPVHECLDRLARSVPPELLHAVQIHGADHRLQVSGTEVFAASYFELLGNFVRSQVGGPETASE